MSAPSKRRRKRSSDEPSVDLDGNPLNVERLHDNSTASTSREPPRKIMKKNNNKKLSNNSKYDPDKDGLRQKLNNDLLLEVFQYLNVYDLIQLCDLDIFYQDLINSHTIKRKLINFTKMEPCWTTNKIFRVFGKSMRKIKIAEENTLGSFERFLQFVQENCDINGLTYVELRYGEPIAAPDILEASMPYFSNLQTLVLNDNHRRLSYRDFLAAIAVNATNLTQLTIQGTHLSGDWLNIAGMQSLKEFRLLATYRDWTINETPELEQFLQTKPQLEVFGHIGGVNLSPAIVNTLIEYCPRLRAFGDFHFDNPFDHRNINTITEPMINRYAYMQNFIDVTTVGLTSYTLCGSDIYYPLKRLAARNRVETLKIYMNRFKIIELPDSKQMHFHNAYFTNFTRLKSIDLQIRSELSELSEDILHAEFIYEFICKLTTIEKFSLSFEPSLANIHQIIDGAPHLNELGISQVKIKYLPVEVLKIVRSIRKRRAKLIEDGETNPQLYHVVVNIHQWREFSVYPDFNKTFRTTIDRRDFGKSFYTSGV